MEIIVRLKKIYAKIISLIWLESIQFTFGNIETYKLKFFDLILENKLITSYNDCNKRY